MSLQNYVDKVGPAVSAAWLNQVDRLKFSVFADASTKTGARTALTSDAPLEVANGGTGARTADDAQTLLFADSALSIANGGTGKRTRSGYYIQTAEEIAASFTPTNYDFPPGHAKRAGCACDGVTNDRVKLQSLLDISLFSTGRVPEVYIPAGPGCSIDGPLLLYKNSNLYGGGKNKSFLIATHTGDAIQSTWTLNQSTNVTTKIHDLGITTTAGVLCTGAGIAETAGTYIDVDNCYIYNFKYGIILDQSELVTITRCIFTSIYNVAGAGVWIVNGADHAVGALPGFTNGITIAYCQFNYTKGAASCYAGILDDGGACHAFFRNNFDGCQYGVRAAYVAGLTMFNNEHENAYLGDIYLDETTRAGTYYGPVYGFDIKNCIAISPGTSGGTPAGSIIIRSAINGEITGNVLGNYATSAIYFPNTAALAYNVSAGIRIASNDKVVTGTGKTAGPFVGAANGAVLKMCQIDQVPVTYVALAVGATGSQTFTPACMEGVREGARYSIGNADGSNREMILITAITATTATATFVSTKAANWTMRGGTPLSEVHGSGAFAAATSVVIELPADEYDAKYWPELTFTSDPGGRVWVSAIGTSTFTVNCSASNSATFKWRLVRD